MFEKISDTTAAAGDYTSTQPITLSNADIKAILDYLETVYGYAAKGSYSVGYNQTDNTFFYTFKF